MDVDKERRMQPGCWISDPPAEHLRIIQHQVSIFSVLTAPWVQGHDGNVVSTYLPY